MFIGLLLADETWRNKNPEFKFNFVKRRAQQSILNPTVQACDSIIHLKNGHLSKFRDQSIQTVNTCGFDAIFVAMCAMYADYANVKQQIDHMASDSGFLSMITEVFTSDIRIAARISSLLEKRNLFLYAFFGGKDYGNGLIYVECSGNVNRLIPKFLPTGLYSYYRKKQCDCCGQEIPSDRCFIDIDMDQYDRLSISHLNECLLDSLINDTASQCSCNGMRRVIETRFSNFIMIDLHLQHHIKLISLRDVPLELNILDIRYMFAGCIEYINDSTNVKSMGHYVCHMYRRNKQFEMYDDIKSRVLRSDTKAKIKGQILFYVRNE